MEKSSTQRNDIGTGSVDSSSKNPSQSGRNVETDQRNKPGQDNELDQPKTGVNEQKKDQQNQNKEQGDQRRAS